MPEPIEERWRFIAVRKNRPFLVFDPRNWVYTGRGFVSEFSPEFNTAMSFGELWLAEGVANHLRMLGIRACARRASYAECKKLELSAIRQPENGERVVQRRFRGRDQQIDAAEYWPHR